MSSISRHAEPRPASLLPKLMFSCNPPLDVQYHPHSCTFAPTIMISNFTSAILDTKFNCNNGTVQMSQAFRTQNEDALATSVGLLAQQFRLWTDALTQEANEAHWRVTPNRFLLQAGHSTRSAWLIDFTPEDLDTVEFFNKVCSMCLPRTEEQNHVRRIGIRIARLAHAPHVVSCSD